MRPDVRPDVRPGVHTGAHDGMRRGDKGGAVAAPRTSVAISFGSPAGDSGFGRLDLNEVLIRHPQAAFLMRIAGTSMRGAGIDDGDLALVDRAITALHGHVVIAVIGDELVCRRLVRQAGALRLQCVQTADSAPAPTASANPADRLVDEDEPVQVWGVVTNVIKTLVV